MPELNNDQQLYIREHYEEMSPREMGKAIDYMWTDKIREFMNTNGLISIHKMRLLACQGKALTESDKEYIKKYYQELTISEMSVLLKTNYIIVYKFMNKEKLRDKKEGKRGPKFTASDIQMPLVRPQAIYSNTNWQDHF